MRQYIAVMMKDEDSSYGVYFPDCPGCFSAGDTAEEAFANSREALSSWASAVDELPKVSTLDELRKTPEFNADIEQGGIAFAVPLVSLGRRRRVNVMIDPDLVIAADMAAKAAGVSRSDLVNSALRSSLEETLGIAAVERGERQSA